MESENKSKLQEMTNTLEESEKRKREAELKNKQLNDTTQMNSDTINDLNSELEKKKREIIDLSAQISSLDNAIREKREKKKTNAPF